VKRLELIKRSTDFTTEHGNGLYVDVLSANDFNWMIHKIESLSEENEQLQRDNKHLAKEHLELKRSYAQTSRKLKKSREDRRFAKNELDKLKRLTGGVLK
jgi:predicted RNase H-like nuclease (RuvC/YqgF family)